MRPTKICRPDREPATHWGNQMPEITIHTDGPIVVPAEGLSLKGTDGSAIERPKGSAVALCRCGESSTKPFCDGTHKNVDFQHDPTT